jgi:protein-S-isoprenylcysteine O-methyltransferase Ste14
VKTFWIIVAGACAVVALFFVFRSDYEQAFVAAALGAVCWFLNYRQHLRESLPEHEENEDEESDEETHS